MASKRSPHTSFSFSRSSLDPAILQAQVERTAITGTVSSQAIGCRFQRPRHREFHGFQRETTTNSQGSYELPGAASGNLLDSGLRRPLSPYTADRVEQTIGQTRTLNVRLKWRAAGAGDRGGASGATRQSRRNVGAAIEQAQVNDLPINGRNWATLTSLAPGAIDNGAGDQRTIRFAGHGLDDNNLTLDGVDATAIYNQEQREYMRLNIPLDSIERVSGAIAELRRGRESGTAGGQVSVVSPSGTNALSRRCLRLLPQ